MAWISSGATNAGMVRALMQNGVIRDARVYDAMMVAGREFFVPAARRDLAHLDRPLPIGHGATISAPHMHAMALELLKDSLIPGARVLDVGSGSGYLLACMAHMVLPGGRVYGVEHIPELASQSSENIAAWRSSGSEADAAGANIAVVVGDGYAGLPASAPFDAIHVGAAAPAVPPTLVAQLRRGGRLLVPVGAMHAVQKLTLVTRRSEDGELTVEEAADVMCVRGRGASLMAAGAGVCNPRPSALWYCRFIPLTTRDEQTRRELDRAFVVIAASSPGT